MKGLLLVAAACAALLAHGAGTRMASQDWVRRYFAAASAAPVAVTTNAADGTVAYAPSESARAAAADGSAATNFTVVVGRMTNILFRCRESNVAGVSSGDVWRVVGGWLYSTNAVLPAIEARLWMDEATSNVTWRLWASNRVTAATYASTRDGAAWVLLDEERPSSRVSLVPERVTDAEADAVWKVVAWRAFRPWSPFLAAVASWLDAGIDPEYNERNLAGDAETCTTDYIVGVKATVTDRNGKESEYTVDFTRGDGGDGKFKKDVTNFAAPPTADDFADPLNWNLGWETIDLGDGSSISTCVLTDTDGKQHVMTSEDLGNDPAWKECIDVMAAAYVVKLRKMVKAHECQPNPDNDCKCVLLDSLHCPYGRGTHVSDGIEASIDIAEIAKVINAANKAEDDWSDSAPEMHDMVTRQGACKWCSRNHDHLDGGTHGRTKNNVCKCDCEVKKVISHVRNVDGVCRCQCGLTVVGHVPKKGACGCECGHFLNEEQTDSETYHPRESKTTCRCYCKRKHYFVEGEKCPNVCADCRKLTIEGVEAKDTDHTPTEDVCGCECGHVDPDESNLAMFHQRMADSCICKGRSGTGGRMHYRCPGECPGVCAYTTGGGTHKVAEEDIEPFVFTADGESDHTAADLACGCKCGKYAGANAPRGMHHWNGLKSPSCVCDCDTYHRGGFVSECEICAKCEVKYSDSVSATGGVVRVSSEGKAEEDDHVPLGDDCGCRCGAIDPDACDLDKFHPEDPDGCLCYGRHDGHGTHDTRGDGGLDCYCACDAHVLIGHVRDGERDCYCHCKEELFGHLWGDEETAEEDRDCPCNCGEKVEHRFDDDKCVCRCGKTTRDHVPGESEQEPSTTAYTCPFCGQTVACYLNVVRCARCNAVIESWTSCEWHGCVSGGDTEEYHRCAGSCPCVKCPCISCTLGLGICMTCGEWCGVEIPDGEVRTNNPIDM